MVEEVDGQVYRGRGREVRRHGLDPVHDVAGHGPVRIRELPVRRAEVDERPPHLLPSRVAEAVRVERLEGGEEPIAVVGWQGVDVGDEVEPAAGVLARVLDDPGHDLGDPGEQLGVRHRLGLGREPTTSTAGGTTGRGWSAAWAGSHAATATLPRVSDGAARRGRRGGARAGGTSAGRTG